MVRIGVFGSHYFEQFAEEIQKDQRYAGVQLFYINDENIEDYQKKAVELDSQHYDIVLSGPANHSRISRYMRTPGYTIHISIAGFLALHNKIMDYEKTAFLFCYPENLDFTILQDALHVNYHVYYYHFLSNDISNLSTLLLDLKEKGYKTIVGTRNVVVSALALGFEALYYYSRLNMEHAIDEALQIVENINNEKSYMDELRSILESSMSGVISVTGKDNEITYINKTALDMIHRNRQDLLNQPLKKFLPHERTLQLLQLGQSENAVQFALCGVEMIGNILSTELLGNIRRGFLLFDNVSNILEYETLIRKRIQRESFGTRYCFDQIIGRSPALNKAILHAQRFAQSNSTVLIQAETGSGKEVFAQSIHAAGLRRDFPFVAINCSSLPDSLIESELFGYVPGAFTGASSKGKVGLIETANHGTVFLDDIDAISPAFQAKLLRVMQEKEIIRIGGNRTIPVDVRFIIASNRSLKKLVQEGSFRNDLYYRINVLTLYLPPLRERREDILLLLQHYLRSKDRALYEKIKNQFQDIFVLAFLYSYPGNIRELVSIVERFTALAEAERIYESGYLKNLVQECLNEEPMENSLFCMSPDDLESENTKIPGTRMPLSGSGNYAQDIAEAENAILSWYLEKNGGNVQKTAQMVGMSRATLYNKIRELQIMRKPN